MSVFTNPAGATPEQVCDYAAAVLRLLGEQDADVVLRQMNESLDRLIEGLTLELAQIVDLLEWSVLPA